METFIDANTCADIYTIYEITQGNKKKYELYDRINNNIVCESDDLDAVKVAAYNLTKEFNSITDEEIEQFVEQLEKTANKL